MFACERPNYKNDSSKRNYRNSNINNYTELINFYIKNDFTAVRLGQKNCNKINFDHQNLLIIPRVISISLMDIFNFYTWFIYWNLIRPKKCCRNVC